VELVVAHLAHRAVGGVGCRIADEHVNPSPSSRRLFGEMLQFLFRRYVSGHSDGASFAVLRADRRGDFLAGLDLSRGNDHLRTVPRHVFGDGATDATRGPCDHRDLAVEIKQRHGRRLPRMSMVFSKLSAASAKSKPIFRNTGLAPGDRAMLVFLCANNNIPIF
jgi:hypothetical protein